LSSTGALPIWLTILQKGDRLSDIEFLSIKEFGNKLKTNTGQQADGGTGNTATLTASGGKDLYLAKATVTFRRDALHTGGPRVLEVTLVANGTIKDRLEFSEVGSSTNGPWGNGGITVPFTVQGIKVLAGETIVIDVVTSNADVDISGTLVGFEEDTGTTPQV